MKQNKFSFALLFFLFWLYLPIISIAQNSTVYGIHGYGSGNFSHIDIGTGAVVSKATLKISIHDGTSTYDPATQTYFIAGNRDTGLYLLSIHAPTGNITKEQQLFSKGQLYSGFQFNYKNGKIYGSRQDSTSNKLYLVEIDPENETWKDLREMDSIYVAGSAGTAIDPENGRYFTSTYGAKGFHVTTFNIATGEKLSSVSINLPTANYYYDTAAKKLFALYSSIPRFALVEIDFMHGKHFADSIPYFRSSGTVQGRWYTYDKANSAYILPYSEGHQEDKISIIGTNPAEVTHTAFTNNIIMLTELEYDEAAVNDKQQLSGTMISSEGKILDNAKVYAAINDGSGNFTFTDSAYTDSRGNFTLTTSEKAFYIYIKPNNQQFPSEAPTWYPGTVHANNAKIYSLKSGINLLKLSSAHVSALSIAESIRLSRHKIYPNPVQNSLHITSSSKIIKLEVTDILGRVVMQKNAGNSSQFSLPMPEQMKNGIYYLKIYTAESIETQSFIKQ